MPKIVRFHALGGPENLKLEELPARHPGEGEVKLRVQAVGLNRAELVFMLGLYREHPELPSRIGYEAAGVVEAVGPGVTDVQPGDFVILNWRAVCGQCRSCRRGRPQYCFATHNAKQKMTLEDGTVLSPALGIGAFASPSAPGVFAPARYPS